MSGAAHTVVSMRILHTSDWHIGRSFHGHSTLDALRGVLETLAAQVRDHDVDVVIVAGDVFDSATPSADCYTLLTDALVAIRDAGAQVVVTSGNHDSAARLGFQSAAPARRHPRRHRPASVGTPVTIDDEHGPVHFYGIPFLEPSLVRQLWPGVELRTQAQALAQAMELVRADLAERGGRSVVDLALLRRRRRADSAPRARHPAGRPRRRAARGLRRRPTTSRSATSTGASSSPSGSGTPAPRCTTASARPTSRAAPGSSSWTPRASPRSEWLDAAGPARLVTLRGRSTSCSTDPAYERAARTGCAPCSPTRRRSSSRCAGCRRASRSARRSSTTRRAAARRDGARTRAACARRAATSSSSRRSSPTCAQARARREPSSRSSMMLVDRRARRGARRREDPPARARGLRTLPRPADRRLRRVRATTASSSSAARRVRASRASSTPSASPSTARCLATRTATGGCAATTARPRTRRGVARVPQRRTGAGVSSARRVRAAEAQRRRHDARAPPRRGWTSGSTGDGSGRAARPVDVGHELGRAARPQQAAVPAGDPARPEPVRRVPARRRARTGRSCCGRSSARARYEGYEIALDERRKAAEQTLAAREASSRCCSPRLSGLVAELPARAPATLRRRPSGRMRSPASPRGSRRRARLQRAAYRVETLGAESGCRRRRTARPRPRTHGAPAARGSGASRGGRGRRSTSSRAEPRRSRRDG